LMSACMPAPPEESDPAMLRMRGGVGMIMAAVYPLGPCLSKGT
jgi:hypothetical protein